MKIVLEHTETKRFFAEGGEWVDDIEKAMCFENSVEAEEHYKKESLSNAMILIKTASGNDVRLRCNR